MFIKLMNNSFSLIFSQTNQKFTVFQNGFRSRHTIMAEYLASIFGTEKDKVNCSFFFKIGACTHGERCSRIHNRPTFSQTILLQNLYINPQNSAKTADGSHLANVTDEEMQVIKYTFYIIVRHKVSASY